jgi:hypothetical protein
MLGRDNQRIGFSLDASLFIPPYTPPTFSPAEMCEESEVSELSRPEGSGVAKKRLRFVLFEFP